MYKGKSHIYWIIVFSKGVEEEIICSIWEWRCCWSEKMQEHGDSLWISTAGSQMHLKLLLWICHAQRVRFNKRQFCLGSFVQVNDQKSTYRFIYTRPLTFFFLWRVSKYVLFTGLGGTLWKWLVLYAIQVPILSHRLESWLSRLGESWFSTPFYVWFPIAFF